MDWLYSLLDNSSVPVVTAMILGILTAVSPCPLATNLTAVAYLGRELDNRRKVFYLGSAELISCNRQRVADVPPHSDEVDKKTP